MKKIFVVSVFAALSLAACTNVEPDVAPVNTENNGSFTLTAQTESGSTKAGISGNDTDGYDVVWENGDKIFVYTPPVAGYASGEISVKSGFGTTSAVFDVDKPVNVGDPIWSPAALGGSLDNGEGLSWPGQQVYSSTYGVSGIPMFGTAMQPVGDGQNIQFSNLGGMLKITLFGNDRLIVKSISIKSAVTPVSGSIAVDDSGDKPVAVIKNNDSEAAKTINLEVPDVPLSEEGTPFFINMVPGGYEGIEIYVTFSSNEVMTKRLKEGKVLNIERSRITPIQFTLENFSVKAIMPEIEDPDFDQVWEEGDEVFVYTPSGAGYASGGIRVKGSGTTSATLDTNLPLINGADVWSPASLGGSMENGLSWPSRQSYSAANGVSGIPMYGTASPVVDGKQKVQFKNLGGLLRITLKGDSRYLVTGIYISCNDRFLAGYFNIVNEDGAPVPQLVLDSGYENDASNGIELTCGEGVALNTETGKDFYINMMPGEYTGVELCIMFKDVKDCNKKLKASSTVKVTRSEITPINITLPDYPVIDKLLPGRFSVSASKTICFARGNLYYSWDNIEWWLRPVIQFNHFFIGQSQYERPVDNYDSYLFYRFATYYYKFEDETDYHNRARYGLDIGPYFGQDWYGEVTPPDEVLSYALELAGISKEPGEFFTLSKDEWQYLLNGRADWENRGYAMVNDVFGYMLLPDGFVMPHGLEFHSRISKNDASQNSFNGNSWKRMESAGAVFLRADGHYDGDDERVSMSASGYMTKTLDKLTKQQSEWIGFNEYYYVFKFDAENGVLVEKSKINNRFSIRLCHN